MPGPSLASYILRDTFSFLSQSFVSRVWKNYLSVLNFSPSGFYSSYLKPMKWHFLFFQFFWGKVMAQYWWINWFFKVQVFSSSACFCWLLFIFWCNFEMFDFWSFMEGLVGGNFNWKSSKIPYHGLIFFCWTKKDPLKFEWKSRS